MGSSGVRALGIHSAGLECLIQLNTEYPEDLGKWAAALCLLNSHTSPPVLLMASSQKQDFIDDFRVFEETKPEVS